MTFVSKGTYLTLLPRAPGFWPQGCSGFVTFVCRKTNLTLFPRAPVFRGHHPRQLSGTQETALLRESPLPLPGVQQPRHTSPRPPHPDPQRP